MDYLLITNGLTKKYKKQKAADNISIHISKGDIYGLIGRNGAGKTTLMRMISGLASPTSGTFEILGQAGGKAAEKVGSLIEDPGIYGDMTAYQNLHAKCIALGVKDKNAEYKLLNIVGLANTGRKKVKKFSLGMKQRLGIALALVGDPDLVILDEPINGLDPQGIAEVRSTIERLNRENGITFIISSHILGELSKLATRFGIINQGQLIDEFTQEELLNKCSKKIILKVNDVSAASAKLESMSIANYKAINDSTIEIYDHLEEIAKINTALVKADIEVSEIRSSNQELEDYFISITGGNGNV